MADVVVVGGGHNGLICAAYLARRGIETVLVEARQTVGGCASTVTDVDARFNICNCDHTMIRAMPVIDELDLESHGLRYLEPAASFVHAFHDGGRPWWFFANIEQHLDALAATHGSATVAAYRRYLDHALPVAELVVEMARTRPGALRMASRAARRRPSAWARLMRWSGRSATDVLTEYFDDWHLWMPAVSTGPTVWGVPPSTPGTGLAALAYATRHLVKTGRPEGGSGALPDALSSSFRAAGGQVRCGARVAGITVDGGAVSAVRLDDGTHIDAAVVVAACDPRRVFVDWLDGVPRGARRQVARWRSEREADGYESKIDGVMSALPRYLHADALAAAPVASVDPLEPTTVVSPSPDDLAQAHERLGSGGVADRPTLLVNLPSVLDPAMRTPDGSHILSLEVLFTPYAHPGGWATSTEPARWLDVWSTLCHEDPRTDVRRWRAMTPDRYEREFSMHRGHTPSYAGSPLSALAGRRRELTRYRTDLRGLYLTGAGTFPGAGIFGASGRNVAAVVDGDLRRGGVSGRRPRRARAAAP